MDRYFNLYCLNQDNSNKSNQVNETMYANKLQTMNVTTSNAYHLVNISKKDSNTW